MKLKYAPGKMDNVEFHRIREWHNTFNAALTGLLMRRSIRTGEEARRKARLIADAQHGQIYAPDYSFPVHMRLD